MTRKKVIKMKDLDAVKQNKELEKKINEAFERHCLICNQIMQHIGNFIWLCKRCDTLTTITHIVSFRDTERKNTRDGKFIEYE